MSNKGHYGISFPFRVGVKGGIAMSGTDINSARHIEESIQQILSTRIGERVMEYHFGCSVSASLFEPTDTTLMNLLKYEIVEALETFETRIEVKKDDIKIYSETDIEGINKIIAEIPYVVKDYTNSEHIAIIDLGGEN